MSDTEYEDFSVSEEEYVPDLDDESDTTDSEEDFAPIQLGANRKQFAGRQRERRKLQRAKGNNYYYCHYYVIMFVE